jgi:GMP synthase (glutamine-hydrolysing)
MATPPGVLVVQHVAAEPPSAVAAAVEKAGGEVKLVRVFDGEPVPADVGEHAGLVVMGGPMGVYEADRHPHLDAELRLIGSALARQVPTLGICLGSQLLAAALGAPVRPGPRKEIGWYPVSLEPAARDDHLFRDLPVSFRAMHWHGDIFDLPAGAASLARSELTAVQAFSFGGFAYGLLFHLEVTSRQLSDMTGAFADELQQAGVPPREILEGWFTHGMTLETLAAMVFGRWMDLVQRRQRVV